jgi:hypothetical protein
MAQVYGYGVRLNLNHIFQAKWGWNLWIMPYYVVQVQGILLSLCNIFKDVIWLRFTNSVEEQVLRLSFKDNS